MALDLGIFLQGAGSSNKVKVTDNDALAQYLKDKITSVDSSVTITERDNGSVETLDLSVAGGSDTNIANTNLTNDANRVVDLNGFKTGFTGGELGVGGALPDDSAQLDVSSTDKGLLIPRVTRPQMDAIVSPAINLLVFNTDLEALYRHDGSNWVALSAGYGIVGVNDANGKPTYYASLASAVSAISGNGVVTLYSDILIDDASEEATMAVNDVLTINGNGYTITHTCNTGDNFNVINCSGSNTTLHLNNVKIISNGTASGVVTATVIGRSSGAPDKIYCDKNTYIYALNNNIFDQSSVYGGRFEAVNGYVAFSGKIYDADIITAQTRGDFYNCRIRFSNNGGISGNSTTEIFNCHIEGSATTRDLVSINNSCQFLDNTVICTGGTFDAVQVNGGSPKGITIQNCTIINKGTGMGVNGVYLTSIKDTYIYSNGMGFDCVIPGSTDYAAYNVENVTVITNSTNQPAFKYRGSQTYKIKNLIASCADATNTEEAILITSTPTIYLEDCTANVANASVDNVLFTGAATAYIFGLKMNSTGTGLDLGTATLGNTSGTIDQYGNGQVQ